jgi:hypothetical protein
MLQNKSHLHVAALSSKPSKEAQKDTDILVPEKTY